MVMALNMMMPVAHRFLLFPLVLLCIHLTIFGLYPNFSIHPAAQFFLSLPPLILPEAVTIMGDFPAYSLVGMTHEVTDPVDRFF